MFNLKHNKKFLGFERALTNSGWKFQFLLRICPISPFNIVNYLIGLTSVTLMDNAIGMTGISIPLAYEVYVGTQIKVIADINKQGGLSKKPWQVFLIILGVLWGLALIGFITMKAKQEIKKIIDEDNEAQPNSDPKNKNKKSWDQLKFNKQRINSDTDEEEKIIDEHLDVGIINYSDKSESFV